MNERDKQPKSAINYGLTNQGLLYPRAETSANTDLWVASTIALLGNDEVRDAWHKCVERSADDSDGAITTARSLVESTCKQVLHGRNVVCAPATQLTELLSLLRRELSWDPGVEANKSIQKVLQGCMTTLIGLGDLRNALGDSHGKGPGASRPAQRHAGLAVSLAGSMAAFILATDDGQKRP